MKKGMLVAVILLLVVGQLYGQSRRNQVELFAGAALPMAPDEFKDYYKIGYSFHGQYVIFPSPKLGISFGVGYEMFTFDDKKVKEEAGVDMIDFDQFDVEGSANIIEIGIGIRPYLTAPEATTQLFVFAMGTYNLLKAEQTVEYAYEDYDYWTDQYYTYSGKETYKGDEDKVGLAVGAGLEIPASDSMNFIIQALYRFIFTEDETTSFLGITGGVAF